MSSWADKEIVPRTGQRNYAMDDFPTVYWSAWASDATFLPGAELPA
jgi:hypothetical protein